VDTAVHEEVRAARGEGSKCRTEHGQTVCASGEVERVASWRVDTAMLSNG
jgi:hypothetical protein